MTGNELVTQPDSGDEVGRQRFKATEIAVHRQERPDVFLGIAPATGGAMAQQSVDELDDEIAIRLVDDERLQEDGIGAASGVEQEIVAVSVGGCDRRGAGRLGDPVIKEAAYFGDRRLRGCIVGEDEEQPAEAFEGEAFEPGLAQQGAGFGGVVVVEQFANVEGVGGEAAAGIFGIP